MTSCFGVKSRFHGDEEIVRKEKFGCWVKMVICVQKVTWILTISCNFLLSILWNFIFARNKCTNLLRVKGVKDGSETVINWSKVFLEKARWKGAEMTDEGRNIFHWIDTNKKKFSLFHLFSLSLEMFPLNTSSLRRRSDSSIRNLFILIGTFQVLTSKNFCPLSTSLSLLPVLTDITITWWWRLKWRQEGREKDGSWNVSSSSLFPLPPSYWSANDRSWKEIYFMITNQDFPHVSPSVFVKATRIKCLSLSSSFLVSSWHMTPTREGMIHFVLLAFLFLLVIF